MSGKERLIYGIYREKSMSPGKVEADAAILDAVLAGMAAAEWAVKRLSADALPPEPPAAAGILHMAQGPDALDILERWEERGVRLINSPQAVRRCYRRYLFPLLAERGLAYPRTRLYGLVEAEKRWTAEFPGPGWLKRAEVHAETAGDVRRVDSLNQALEVVEDFRPRGIDRLIWQEHVPGREIKFYGVGPGFFFRTYLGESPEPADAALFAPALQRLAEQAARLAGVAIFGGDAIITPEGQPVLIDLNDWPSFSRCREEAAQEIVRYVRTILSP
jgi:glutathione synthase/RimK-type ligase-like ATP-grasp enzyme